MGNPDTSSWMTGEADDRAEQRFRPPRRSYQAPADYPARPRHYGDPAQRPYASPVRQPYDNPVQRPYAEPSDYTIPQRSYEANGLRPYEANGLGPYEANGLVAPSRSASRQVSRRSLATSSVSLQPAHQLRGKRRAQVWTRRQRTWPQRVGGLLIAGACVAAVAWYVPRVMRDDRQLFTGTVTSSGIITLNFAVSGEIGKVNVHLDQQVRKGQVLAAEYAPNIDSVVAADKAAIAAEQAKLAQLRAAEAADPAAAPADNTQLGAEKAQLALDEAQLETDQAKVTATEIVAPSAGTIIAANGQPGETVTSAGIRNYFTDSAQAPTSQGPAFSLFPEGPQTVHRTSASQSALPVVALRISASWQVVALIPEGSISRISKGGSVTISVPAGHITAVPGQITEILPTPTSTSAGTFYQAVITITGHPTILPLNGMTADIRIGS
jgi:multidrug resistance efflux pump